MEKGSLMLRSHHLAVSIYIENQDYIEKTSKVRSSENQVGVSRWYASYSWETCCSVDIIVNKY